MTIETRNRNHSFCQAGTEPQAAQTRAGGRNQSRAGPAAVGRRRRTARRADSMDAPLSLCALYAFLAISGTASDPRTVTRNPVRSESDLRTDDDGLGVRKLELFDGVSLKIPPSSGNDTKLFSFELDLNRNVPEGREKKNNLMQRILPLFIMPFLLQSAIVPMFLSMLKFMLMKSLMVGKIALALIVFNAFKNHNSVRGRDAEIADVHYGYHGNGMEEYGAYVNN